MVCAHETSNINPLKANDTSGVEKQMISAKQVVRLGSEHALEQIFQ